MTQTKKELVHQNKFKEFWEIDNYKTFEDVCNILKQEHDEKIKSRPINTHCQICSSPLYWEDEDLDYQWRCGICGRFLNNQPPASPLVSIDQAPACDQEHFKDGKLVQNQDIVIKTQPMPCISCINCNSDDMQISETEELQQQKLDNGANKIHQISKYYSEHPYERGVLKREIRGLNRIDKTKLLHGQVPKYLPDKYFERIDKLTQVNKNTKKSYFENLFRLALLWEIDDNYRGVRPLARATEQSIIGKVLNDGYEIKPSSLCDRFQDPEVIEAANVLLGLTGIAASQDTVTPIYYVDSMWLILKGDSYKFAKTKGSENAHGIKITLLRDFHGAIINVCVHYKTHPADQTCLQEHLMTWEEPKRTIFIFDRGYEDLSFFQKLEEHNYHYIMYFEEDDFTSTVLEEATPPLSRANGKLPKKSGDENYRLLSIQRRKIGVKDTVKSRVINFQRTDEDGYLVKRMLMTNKYIGSPHNLIGLSFLRWRRMETGYDILKNELGLNSLKVKNGASALSIIFLLLAGVNILMLMFRNLHAEHGGEFSPTIAKGALRVYLEWLAYRSGPNKPSIPACNVSHCPYG